MACDNLLAPLTMFTQEPSEPLLKSQFNSDTYYKSRAFTTDNKVTAHKSSCHVVACFAMCCDNDLYSDRRRDNQNKEKEWRPFTDFSWTSQKIVDLLLQLHSKKQIKCSVKSSVFVRKWGGGLSYMTARGGIPRCHTLSTSLPESLASVLWWQQPDTWWAKAFSFLRKKKKSTSDNQLTRLWLDWLTHSLTITGWLTVIVQRSGGCRAVPLISDRT